MIITFLNYLNKLISLNVIFLRHHLQRPAFAATESSASPIYENVITRAKILLTVTAGTEKAVGW